MKKNFHRNFLKLFYPALVACSLFFITACRQPVKFAQIKYTSGQINHWLNLANTGGFIFQFYTPKVDDAQQPYQLISYVTDTTGGFLNGGHPDTLSEAKDSVVNLSGKAILGNNVISKKGILAIITDSLGRRRDFDYLLFIPTKLPSDDHVIYFIKLFKGDTDINYRHHGATNVNTDPLPHAAIQWK